MTATTWIETPKALYRMASRGGRAWNRLKGRLSPDLRVELARLNQRVEMFAAELNEAKQAVERENAARQERLRLRRRWEDARRVALDPPEAFDLATRLVAILHLESTRKYRSKDLARRVDAEANSPAFLEAVQLSLIAGFAERTTSGKLRAVRAADLRGSWHEVRSSRQLAGRDARTLGCPPRCTHVDAPPKRVGPSTADGVPDGLEQIDPEGRRPDVGRAGHSCACER